MVRKKSLPVHWDLLAKNEFKRAIHYYKKFSVQGADNVKRDILKAAGQLSIFPEKHPVEPALGAPFRFVVVRDFKLIYYSTSKVIRIVDLFNCNQNPLKIVKRSKR